MCPVFQSFIITARKYFFLFYYNYFFLKYLQKIIFGSFSITITIRITSTNTISNYQGWVS